MAINLSKAQLAGQSSSLKLWKEDVVNLLVAARGANDYKYDRQTIAHGYPTDDLRVEVGFKNQFTDETMKSPFSASGGTYVVAWIDGGNLYIEAGDFSVAAQPDPMPFIASYRILIP